MATNYVQNYLAMDEGRRAELGMAMKDRIQTQVEQNAAFDQGYKMMSFSADQEAKTNDYNLRMQDLSLRKESAAFQNNAQLAQMELNKVKLNEANKGIADEASYELYQGKMGTDIGYINDDPKYANDPNGRYDAITSTIRAYKDKGLIKGPVAEDALKSVDNAKWAIGPRSEIEAANKRAAEAQAMEATNTTYKNIAMKSAQPSFDALPAEDPRRKDPNKFIFDKNKELSRNRIKSLFAGVDNADAHIDSALESVGVESTYGVLPENRIKEIHESAKAVRDSQEKEKTRVQSEEKETSRQEAAAKLATQTSENISQREMSKALNKEMSTAEADIAGMNSALTSARKALQEMKPSFPGTGASKDKVDAQIEKIQGLRANIDRLRKKKDAWDARVKGFSFGISGSEPSSEADINTPTEVPAPSIGVTPQSAPSTTSAYRSVGTGK